VQDFLLPVFFSCPACAKTALLFWALQHQKQKVCHPFTGLAWSVIPDDLPVRTLTRPALPAPTFKITHCWLDQGTLRSSPLLCTAQWFCNVLRGDRRYGSDLDTQVILFFWLTSGTASQPQNLSSSQRRF